jgi:hypothetical protein
VNRCQSIALDPIRQRRFIPADWYERLATDAFSPPGLPLFYSPDSHSNWIFNPTLRLFRQIDETQYSFAITEGVTNEIQ